MFTLNLTTIAFLLLWVILLLLAIKLDTPMAKAFRKRLVLLLGFTLLGCGFFFQPWIKFEFLEYILPTPELLGVVFSGGALTKLVHILGATWMSKILHVFHMFTRLNGWQIEFIPTLGIWLRIRTLLPLFPFVISLPAVLIGTSLPGCKLSRVLGWVLIVSSLITGLLLLTALPGLDCLGIQDEFQWEVFATLLGTRLGNGPWLCIFGLLLIAAGGVIELIEPNKREIEHRIEY